MIILEPKTAILGPQFVEFWCWGLIFGGGGPGPPGPPGSTPVNGFPPNSTRQAYNVISMDFHPIRPDIISMDFHPI